MVDAGRFTDALVAVRRLAELFGWDNTFVELQHNQADFERAGVACGVEAQAEGARTAAATG